MEKIKIKSVTKRNAVCAIFVKAATFKDARTKRNRTRSEQNRKAINEYR